MNYKRNDVININRPSKMTQANIDIMIKSLFTYDKKRKDKRKQRQ